MNFAIVLFPFLIKSIFGNVCEVCENLVQEFHVELQKSEKSNFGGGNTAWEERKLGNYATSETRLVHILEKLCPSTISNRDKCQHFREEVEEKIEEWWFQIFKKDQSASSLFQYLCIDNMKVCCPSNHYGKSCELCLNYNQTSGSTCSGHGNCDGNGTRSGNGTCLCFDGYTGNSCNECSYNYYASNNDTSITCNSCHPSCVGCSGEGPDKCDKCANGWLLDNDKCIDIDECLNKDICDKNNYCQNTEGSYKCIRCDQSCDNCTSSGSDNCVSCNNGYQKINNNCEDINECSADSELCRETGQKCTNIPGSYSCDCMDNFIKQTDGTCKLTESKPISSSNKKYSDTKTTTKPKTKNRKQPKKIWTRKFEREFFKLLCCIFLLGLVSYFFGYYSIIVLIAALLCGYYIYYKSIKLDQIFSKSVIV